MNFIFREGTSGARVILKKYLNCSSGATEDLVFEKKNELVVSRIL